LLTGLAAVVFAQSVRKRSDLIASGFFSGLVGLSAVWGFNSFNLSHVFTWISGMEALACGICAGFVASAILPVLEGVFHRITDISWLELTDLNHPLLKRLTMEAPGTYHHSLMVGNLAESAAEAIGANSTMCRVMAYFHDIGKVEKPEYFIENMNYKNNPHDDLTPSMSALVIIAHVKDGVDLALKCHLPKEIIDGIQQHHGTSLVYYFYRKALRQRDDARTGSQILNMREEDTPDVEDISFRYPGPIPQFRECALVSLADSIESASRNLNHPTLQSIEDLVNQIVQQKIEDGQLDDSGLTLNELKTARERFALTLQGMLHTRIQYPKDVESHGQGHRSQSAKQIPFQDK
jgi:putative nucleotidyltransferase with HDIG domain